MPAAENAPRLKCVRDFRREGGGFGNIGNHAIQQI